MEPKKVSKYRYLKEKRQETFFIAFGMGFEYILIPYIVQKHQIPINI